MMMIDDSGYDNVFPKPPIWRDKIIIDYRSADP